MSTDGIVLELHEVTVESDHSYDSSIWNVNLRLNAGELALIKLEREHAHLPLADAAEGLIDLAHGTVQFLDEQWKEMPPGRAASNRGKIGRVFDGPGWPPDLLVEESITLAQRHHTRRPEAEIAKEAAEWASHFGLPGLPRGRASQLRRPDLQRAACVRAFLGEPHLLILERPASGVFPDIMPALINAIQAARRRGAAVLWTTDDPAVWGDAGVRPTVKGFMSGSQLLIPERVMAR